MLRRPVDQLGLDVDLVGPGHPAEFGELRSAASSEAGWNVFAGDRVAALAVDDGEVRHRLRVTGDEEPHRLVADVERLHPVDDDGCPVAERRLAPRRSRRRSTDPASTSDTSSTTRRVTTAAAGSAGAVICRPSATSATVATTTRSLAATSSSSVAKSPPTTSISIAAGSSSSLRTATTIADGARRAPVRAAEPRPVPARLSRERAGRAAARTSPPGRAGRGSPDRPAGRSSVDADVR